MASLGDTSLAGCCLKSRHFWQVIGCFPSSQLGSIYKKNCEIVEAADSLPVARIPTVNPFPDKGCYFLIYFESTGLHGDACCHPLILLVLIDYMHN